MSKLIEIANFHDQTDLQMVKSLLGAEGIEYTLMNEITTQVFGGYADIGGVRLCVMSKDAEITAQLLAASGYENNLLVINNEEE